MSPLYIFGIPGPLGGAATKLRDLIRMLRNDYEITVVLRKKACEQEFIAAPLRANGIRFIQRSQLPRRADGVALAVCEEDFFSAGLADRIKRVGLKLVWSNEMMWLFKGEAEAVARGVVDRVIFLSEIQQQAFSRIYSKTDQRIVGNFIHPEDFPFVERQPSECFTIGRLSRADQVKFPPDFPVFYEELRLKNPRYRVQAWSDRLHKIYGWHRFGPEWELYPARHIPPPAFLGSLDLFVYTLSHEFVESWGRVVAEAMLTGAIPLVPDGHGFERIVIHEQNGFICRRFAEYKDYANSLRSNDSLRKKMSLNAARHSREALFNFNKHRSIWIDALSF